MRTIVPASVGYWKLYANRDGEVTFQGLILAWELFEGERSPEPVVLGYPPDNRDVYDNAIECPGGQCIDDGDEVHPSREAWLARVKATAAEAEAG